MSQATPDKGKGPGTSYMTGGQDRPAARQDAKQNRDAGVNHPSQTNGAGISPSPTMDVSGDAHISADQHTNVGSGSRPGKSMYAIGTSAPTDARSLNRAPPGWLK